MSMPKRPKRLTLADSGRAIICPPDAAGRSWTLRLLGLACRLLVIFFVAAGLAATVTSAIYLTVPVSTAVSVAFLAVFALGAMSLHPWATVGGALLSVGIVLIKLLASPYGLLGYLQRLFGHGWNAVVTRLYNRGYYNVVDLYVNVPAGGSDAMFVHEFVELLAAVIALIMVLSLVRRARVIPVALLSVVLLVPILTYNFAINNYATLLLVAGLCGALIMVAYDRCYGRQAVKGDEMSTMLFPDRRPPMPEGMEDKRRARHERREQKRQARIDRRLNSPFKTVEEELDDYFRTPGRHKKVKKEKVLSSSEAERQKRIKQLREVRRYDRVTHQSRAAMGGFASAAMCLLAALLLLAPAVSVHGSFKTIESLDTRVDIYREYVTSLLRGEGVSKDLYDYLQGLKDREPHSTLAEPLDFEEIILMEVTSQSNANAYLPSFIGLNYEEGAWQYFNDNQYVKWHAAYGKEALPGEDIFRNFVSLMIPDMNWELNYVEKYQRKAAYGFVAAMYNFRRAVAISADPLLPRIYDPALGVLEYRSLEAADLPFASVFDGIATGSPYAVPGLTYSSVAYSPDQTDKDAYINRARLIAMYNASYDEVLRYEQNKRLGKFKPDYSKTAWEGYPNLAKDYIEGRNSTERKDMMAQWEAARAYGDFAYEMYLDGADSEIVSQFAHEVLTGTKDENGAICDFSHAAERNSSDPATYQQRHLLTMAIIDRLVSENTYTRTPEKETDATLDGIENFLSVTHEGYCVQFASAAVLALRELGIPARFVEGYLASGFDLNIYDQKNGRYKTYVRDSSAHAWVEVWYDGIGWVIYEATPIYYADMYGENSGPAGSLPTPPPITPPEITPPDITPPEVTPPEDLPDVIPPVDLPIDPPVDLPFVIDWDLVTRIAIIAAAVAAVLGVIIWQIIRMAVLAKRAEQKRQRLAKDIASGEEHIFADEESRAAAAQALVRQTMQLLSIYGTPPEAGELKDEYAHRLSFAYEEVLGYPLEYSGELQNVMAREHVSKTNIGALLEAVAAEEFGYGMSPKMMKRLAEFYLTMREHDYKYVGRWRRWKLHYIKREL